MLSQFLPAGTRAVLDVGCNVGDSLRWAHERGIGRLKGVDINPAAVEAAARNLRGLGDVEVRHGSADALPFPDGCVDLVTCLEVLEHIPVELRPAVVREIARVLTPGGRLLLTVPHRGAFAFLDPENMRFRLPWIHRAASGLVGGVGKEGGYAGQKHGVVWHHHFRWPEIEALLRADFTIVAVRGRGCLLFPVCSWLHWPIYRRGLQAHWASRLLDRLKHADYRVTYPLPLAYNVVVVADKR
jgi:SAM-dependent methyltransferase